MEYMVQIEAQSTPECRDSVLCPGGEQEVLHIQVEPCQKKFQVHKPKSQIPLLVPVDYVWFTPDSPQWPCCK